jgi:hypothetical protein
MPDAVILLRLAFVNAPPPHPPLSFMHKNQSKQVTHTQVERDRYQEEMMTMSRRMYTDPGCALPEEISSTKEEFPKPHEHTIDAADEETVVMGNLDQRPAEVGKVEKLNQICSIPEKDREARDRQLIEMYTPRKKTVKSKSQSDGKIDLTSAAVGRLSVLRTPSTQNSSSRAPVLSPEQLYPYYDLVVAEPSTVFDEEFSGSAAASSRDLASSSAPPTRTESPLYMWRRNPPRNGLPPIPKKHEVIVPPFSPKFR